MHKFKKVSLEYPLDHKKIVEKVNLAEAELQDWKKVADEMYFPKSTELDIYLQQDGF
jgi:maltose phosphorylase